MSEGEWVGGSNTVSGAMQPVEMMGKHRGDVMEFQLVNSTCVMADVR